MICMAALRRAAASDGPGLAAACCSTWVSINAATRKLSKLPEDLRNYFLRLSPKPDR